MRRFSRVRVLALVALVAPIAACGDGEPKEGSPEIASADPALVSISTFEACAQVADVARRLPGARVEQGTGSFPAFTGPAQRYGCVVGVSGPLGAAQPVPALVTTFADSLGSDWHGDPAIVADGPAETIYGLWHGPVLCLVRVSWGRSPASDGPREAGERYAGTIGCEERPDLTVPRS